MFFDEEAILETAVGGLDFRHRYHLGQQAITNDHSQLRAVLGARRCGKTTLVAGEALELADQFPGLIVPYLALTSTRAKDIILPMFRQLQAEEGIKLDYLLGEGKVYTPSGGCVQMSGMSSRAEVEKGRGMSIPGLYVDESGAQNQELLKRVVTETYGPATKDFLGLGGRGICLLGTPDYVPYSYWYKMCGGNEHVSHFGASVHHMTIWDNPFYAGREQRVIDAFCRENAMLPDNPVVLREWRGIFCSDTEGLAFPSWNGDLLTDNLIPRRGFTVMGVDLGSDHPSAWVVIRFTLKEFVDGDKLHRVWHGHVVESYEEDRLTVHDVAAITKKMQKNWSVNLTVGDSGGGGAMTVQTINEVMGVNMDPIKKLGLVEDRMWLGDSMFRSGRLHVHDRCESLAYQLRSVPRERDKQGHLQMMDGYPNDSLAAMMYALAAAKQKEQVIDLPPRPGSKEDVEQRFQQDYDRYTRAVKQNNQERRQQWRRKTA